MRALAGGQHGVDAGEGAGAVALERIEGAGRDQAFQHALVDRARIDAGGEVGEIGERPARRAPRRWTSTACAPTPFSAPSA